MTIIGNALAESVMRQKMETWLKSECVNIGLQMMRPSSYLDNILSAMYDDDIKTIMHSIGGFANQLADITHRGWTTSEESVLWYQDVDKTVRKYLDAYDKKQDTIMLEASREINELCRKWEILLLERTVECQCGKHPFISASTIRSTTRAVMDKLGKGSTKEEIVSSVHDALEPVGILPEDFTEIIMDEINEYSARGY